MSIQGEMYVKLFRQVSKTIEELQNVQLECEQLYMDAASGLSIDLAENQEQKPAE